MGGEKTGKGNRVPMHTLAGALHADFRLPSVSYGTMLRMTRLMTRSDDEVLKAYRRCVFNVVFNNRDDHAKNFSYVMNSAGDWQLSPGYDLTYCEGLSGEHQMDVEGEGRAPNLKHLMSLSQSVGLNPKACKKIIEEIAEQGLLFQKIATQYPITHETLQCVKRAIDTNLSRLH